MLLNIYLYKYVNLFCERRFYICRGLHGALKRRLAFLRFVEFDDEPFRSAFLRGFYYAAKIEDAVM